MVETRPTPATPQELADLDVLRALMGDTMDADVALAALVVYVVVSAVPLTVTVAVTVTTLAGSVAVVVPAAFEAEVVVALPVAIAFDWKVSKLLPGLMAKTMPCWQWPVWRQYTQTGLVSVTANWAMVKLVVLLSATGTLGEYI